MVSLHGSETFHLAHRNLFKLMSTAHVASMDVCVIGNWDIHYEKNLLESDDVD
jgi:hypothetical protein